MAHPETPGTLSIQCGSKGYPEEKALIPSLRWQRTFYYTCASSN